MSVFVWTKMQTEAGLHLSAILDRKEAERQSGNGVFWWGIGTSLQRAVVREEAKRAGGELPVLFSEMISPPKPLDINPAMVFLWTE